MPDIPKVTWPRKIPVEFPVSVRVTVSVSRIKLTAVTVTVWVSALVVTFKLVSVT